MQTTGRGHEPTARHDGPRLALDAAAAWCDCPCEEHREALDALTPRVWDGIPWEGRAGRREDEWLPYNDPTRAILACARQPGMTEQRVREVVCAEVLRRVA